MLTALSNNYYFWSFCVHFRMSCLNFFFIDDISHNRIATQSHTYNNNAASRAVDGNPATCMQTDVIGVGTSFRYNTVWWKVDLGGVYSIHSINIQFRNYDGYGLCVVFLPCIYTVNCIICSKVECYTKRLSCWLFKYCFWDVISLFKKEYVP